MTNTHTANINIKLNELYNLVFIHFENKDIHLLFEEIKKYNILPIVCKLASNPNGFELAWIDERYHFDIEIHDNNNYEIYFRDKLINKSINIDNDMKQAFIFLKKIHDNSNI